jgi:hypothetical protein
MTTMRLSRQLISGILAASLSVAGISLAPPRRVLAEHDGHRIGRPRCAMEPPAGNTKLLITQPTSHSNA